MEVYQWLCVLAVPNLIFLLWSTVIGKRIKKNEEKHEQERRKQEREQEEIRRQNEEHEKQIKATMLGVQALLRDRLLQSFKHYISQGYADYNERENVQNMYRQYECLGPNSVMDDLYEQFTELPMQL